MRTSFALILLTLPAILFKDSIVGLPKINLPRIDLPPECKDYSVIKKSPVLPKTVIFGGAHFSNCDQARASCTQAIFNSRKLHNDLTREEVTSLLEPLGNDQEILCEEEGLGKISNDCRGWNIPAKKILKVHDWEMRGGVIGGLMEEFVEKFRAWESSEKTPKMQQAEAVRYIQSHIQQEKPNLQRIQTQYNNFKKAHHKNGSNPYSRIFITLQEAEYKQKLLNVILKKIRKGGSLHEVWQYMTNEREKYANFYNEFRRDHEASFARPNKEMPKAIKKAVDKGKKLIFVYAGDKHVNKNSALAAYLPKDHPRRLYQALDKASVQTLYEDLDALADENPYEVLSCKLTQKM